MRKMASKDVIVTGTARQPVQGLRPTPMLEATKGTKQKLCCLSHRATGGRATERIAAIFQRHVSRLFVEPGTRAPDPVEERRELSSFPRFNREGQGRVARMRHDRHPKWGYSFERTDSKLCNLLRLNPGMDLTDPVTKRAKDATSYQKGEGKDGGGGVRQAQRERPCHCLPCGRTTCWLTTCSGSGEAKDHAGEVRGGGGEGFANRP